MDLLSNSADIVFAGNELWRIIVLITVLALSFFFGKISKFTLTRLESKLEASNRKLAAVAARAASISVTFLFFSFGLTIAFSFLNIPDGFESLLNTVLELLIILAIGHFFYRQVDVIDQWLKRFSSDESINIDDMLIPIVGKSIRVAVVILIMLQAAQSLSDQPITSILAGIGIGGLALGLAAQDTIRNFFGSLMIFADKPFNVGELINLEDKLGTVLEVGVRTTRIKTLDGHILTIPNGNLANMTIHNIGKRPFIRRVFDLNITYDTPPEKVEKAVEIVKDILNDHEGMDPELPPRVYFDNMNSDSLNLKIFYWFHPPDFWAYMDFTEMVNSQIFSRFNEEGIDFAFPTQTIHLAGDKKRPLNVGVNNHGKTESENEKK
ncbi:mechanosensitive ion channel family protein [Rhodohalobacter sp. SW132]|uniref:mechanosensitive ion channel family protein n=1 Tax=Rhodohalobacter sp. SW132 TaxID=2293433 RepID=UPI000E2386BC|nr:mechanosensitive ion channel domain-containing protein [Rhodohalobacter sp. SW132]REL24689.1 mechanosensitive ion channel family protein [Rhodohalobacter sp. SW132]